MLRARLGALLISGLVLFQSTGLHAEEWDQGFRIKDDPTGYVNPALQMLLSAPGRYYSIFGRWPNSWQEIRSCGLVQAPLYDPTGNVVLPDAQTWRFNGDKRYIPSRNGKPPTILAVGVGANGMSVNTVSSVSDHPRTWPEFIADLPSETRAVWEPVLKDKNRLVMFELIPLMRESIRMYIRVHGEAPPTFDALLNSRMSPIDGTSVNPITKDRFYGDGRPNDFKYERHPTKMNAYVLMPVAADGSTPWHGSYL